LSDYTANFRPVLSSERALHRNKTANFRQQQEYVIYVKIIKEKRKNMVAGSRWGA
jgi:hypothetical protein